MMDHDLHLKYTYLNKLCHKLMYFIIFQRLQCIGYHVKDDFCLVCN